jgi:hypothetical protein
LPGNILCLTKRSKKPKINIKISDFVELFQILYIFVNLHGFLVDILFFLKNYFSYRGLSGLFYWYRNKNLLKDTAILEKICFDNSKIDHLTLRIFSMHFTYPSTGPTAWTTQRWEGNNSQDILVDLQGVFATPPH